MKCRENSLLSSASDCSEAKSNRNCLSGFKAMSIVLVGVYLGSAAFDESKLKVRTQTCAGRGESKRRLRSHGAGGGSRSHLVTKTTYFSLSGTIS